LPAAPAEAPEPAPAESHPTRGLAIALLIFGVGSLILPLFGLQFRKMMYLEDAQPLLGIGLAIAGGVLLALSYRAEGG
jgi:hypothetical protein